MTMMSSDTLEHKVAVTVSMVTWIGYIFHEDLVLCICYIVDHCVLDIAWQSVLYGL